MMVGRGCSHFHPLVPKPMMLDLGVCPGRWHHVITGLYLQADTSAIPSEEHLIILPRFSSLHIKFKLAQALTCHLCRKFNITLLVVQHVTGLAGSLPCGHYHTSFAVKWTLRLPSPWEKHAPGSHCPSSLDPIMWHMEQGHPRCLIAWNRVTLADLHEQEISAYCRLLRFCGCLLCSIFVAITDWHTFISLPPKFLSLSCSFF